MSTPSRRRAAALLAAFFVSASISAQSRFKSEPHVQALASEKLEGRLTGSNGERLAAAYIVGELQRIGAMPLPGQTDFRLPFEFTAGTKDGGTRLTLKCEGEVSPGVQSRCQAELGDGAITALSFSDNGDVSGPVVFAGYGIVVPESQNFGYDSYATIDVKDKIVLVLRYFPEDADVKTKSILARYSDLRYKALAARQRGAKALIVVTGPRSPNAGELIPMSFDTALSGSGIVAASVTGAVAGMLFANTEHTLAEAQRALDSANPHVAGFDIPGKTVTLHAAVVREKRTGYNVVGYLPATTATTGIAKPWVALGAHYDHLGHGENGNSLADAANIRKAHVGADDNASGDAAVLVAGAQLASQPRRRNVLLDFWSGEELGLIGSTAFVNKPPVPLDQIEAYLNFDMVGRMQDNKLTIQATGTSAAWGRLIEQANITAGFDLLLQPDPYQPTDVASFNQASIPSLSFFTGTHTDYHKPSDTPEKINYEDLDRVAEFAAAITKRVGDADEAMVFTKVDEVADNTPRAGIRLFTGTVPDYSTEVKGLLLSGVIGGGPAEQAGLQKGDIIIEIAGQSITNIYDYTYALEVLKIGEPVKVVYTREGQRKETTLTPSARK
ncbi:MAG TPA: M28 family peptidase [Vicinamibacterales bacterium]|nr:M28 family peptidase [Vicinamibacterales bacterium]